MNELLDARRRYLSADEALDEASRRYIEVFGRESQRPFRLADGSVAVVWVPANESDDYAEVDLYELTEIGECN